MLINVLAAEAGDARISAMVARQIAWLLGQQVFLVGPMSSPVACVLCFGICLFAVGPTSLKAVCNGMRTSRRLGAGAGACRFGCRAVGGLNAVLVARCLWVCLCRVLPSGVQHGMFVATCTPRSIVLAFRRLFTR